MKKGILSLILAIVVLTLSACGSESTSKSTKETTILEDVGLYDMTLKDIRTYLNDKYINFEEGEEKEDYVLKGRYKLNTVVADKFLDYDCYYDMVFDTAVQLFDDDYNKIGHLEGIEDYLSYKMVDLTEKYENCSVIQEEEGFSNDSPINYLKISVVCKDDEEVRAAGDAIKTYLENLSKKVTGEKLEPFSINNMGISTMYPLEIVEIDGKTIVEYCQVDADSKEDMEGYSKNYYRLQNSYMSKSNWNKLYNEALGIEVEQEEIVVYEDEKKNTDYVEAYVEFLRQQGKEQDELKFQLGYVDEDEIPELFISEGCYTAAGVDVYTYFDKQVVYLGCLGSAGQLKYVEKGNLIENSLGRMDVYWGHYYTIENGTAKEVYAFNSVEDHQNNKVTYKIKEQIVSEEEYIKKQNEVSKPIKEKGVDFNYEEAFSITEENIEAILDLYSFDAKEVIKSAENIPINPEMIGVWETMSSDYYDEKIKIDLTEDNKVRLTTYSARYGREYIDVYYDGAEYVEHCDISENEIIFTTDYSIYVTYKNGMIAFRNGDMFSYCKPLGSEFVAPIDTEDVSKGYILPTSNSEYLTMEDLEGLNYIECRIARNELYARHGRIFTDEILKGHFESQSWYHGTISAEDFTEDILNEYEVANRDLIIQYEEEAGYR